MGLQLTVPEAFFFDHYSILQVNDEKKYGYKEVK